MRERAEAGFRRAARGSGKPLRFGDLASSIDAAARFWIDQNQVITPG